VTESDRGRIRKRTGKREREGESTGEKSSVCVWERASGSERACRDREGTRERKNGSGRVRKNTDESWREQEGEGKRE